MTASTFSVSRRTFTISRAGLDRIGELHRACATSIELRLLAEQAENAKPHAAALDHQIAANHAILGELLETCQRWIVARKVAVRCDHRRNVAGLGGYRNSLGRTIWPEVEIMVAEGGGVTPNPGQQLQFAAGHTSGGGERSPHAIVTCIQD